MVNALNRMRRVDSGAEGAATRRRTMAAALAVAAILVAWAVPSPAPAAMNVYLFLKANGSDIHGDSSVITLGRENSIECLAFSQAIQLPRDPDTGMATGQRTFEPIRFTKRIDKSSPLLAKALANNEVIEAEFRFYRPDPSGNGSTQHFYTIHVTQAGLSTVRPLVQSTIDPDTSGFPALEEVELAYRSITWTYEDGGITFSDTLGGGTAAGAATGLVIEGAGARRSPVDAPKKKTEVPSSGTR